ncbi:hypothetical protein INR49_017888, partial [Caranx melampygus]
PGGELFSLDYWRATTSPQHIKLLQKQRQTPGDDCVLSKKPNRIWHRMTKSKLAHTNTGSAIRSNVGWAHGLKCQNHRPGTTSAEAVWTSRRTTSLIVTGQEEGNLLTGAKLPFVAQAVEVVTLAVLPPHLTELAAVAGALSAQTVASAAADRAVGLRDAVDIIGRAVVLHRALASRAQATRVTLAHAALVRPVAGAAEGAVGLGHGLAVTIAGKVHGDLQGVLKAPRFDDECLRNWASTLKDT